MQNKPSGHKAKPSPTGAHQNQVLKVDPALWLKSWQQMRKAIKKAKGKAKCGI